MDPLHATGFDAAVDTRTGSFYFPPHYKVIALNSMAELRRIFPKGKANEDNWLVCSTSGVHGTYTTLDEIEHHVPDPDDEDDYQPTDVTVLVIQPNLCNLYYGEMYAVSPEDITFLRGVVASSINAIIRTQMGNLPPGWQPTVPTTKE